LWVELSTKRELRERPGIGSMYLEYYMSIDSVQAGIENVAQMYPALKTEWRFVDIDLVGREPRPRLPKHRPRHRKYPLLDTPEKFWAQMDRRENGCWEFIGTRTPKGYGLFEVYGKRSYAHRHALELAKGQSPSPDSVAMHKCDNPPCCNPAHLKWGTQLKNIADAKRKGRMGRKPTTANS
jgi:hypothetical protein